MLPKNILTKHSSLSLLLTVHLVLSSNNCASA